MKRKRRGYGRVGVGGEGGVGKWLVVTCEKDLPGKVPNGELP